MWLPRSGWPAERLFAGEGKDMVTIPRKEVDKRYRDMLDVHAMTVKLVDLDKIVSNGVEASETCGVTKVAEDMRGPEHPENPIVKMFLGGHTTNYWEVLLEKTTVFFRWQAKLLRKKTGYETRA